MTAYVALTVCDVCNSLHLGTGWCHDLRTSEVRVGIIMPAPACDPLDHAPCGCGHLAHDHDGETCHGTAGTMIGQTAEESGFEPDMPCLCTAYGAPR